MTRLTDLYGFIDTFGASLGICTNFILVFTIFKTSGYSKIQSFSHMVLVSAIFDIFFCIVEVITQHQILVRKGVLFLMPHGVESILPEWSYYVFMVPHVFSCTMAVVIRGPQYKFRYDLVTGNALQPILLLTRYVLIAMCPALFCGFSAAFGIYQAKKRGMKHYLEYFDNSTTSAKLKQSFLYACDIRDSGTIGFYGGGFVFTIACFWICVYYTVKTQRFIRSRVVKLNERTKALQKQFTLSLIVQSANAVIFAIIPVSMVCGAMILRLDADFIGVGTMVPLSYLSSANALLTLLIVNSYRNYLKSLMRDYTTKINHLTGEIYTTSRTGQVVNIKGQDPASLPISSNQSSS